MGLNTLLRSWASVMTFLLTSAASAVAAPVSCRNTGSFDGWLAAFKQEAAAQGVSQRAIAAASPLLRFDQGIINRDRGQRFFGQDFITFSGKMLMPYRLQKGAQLIQQHSALFARIEREFGVPAPVLVAFWGLESDFGIGQGKLQVLPSLATLAYDCRRPQMFRAELLAALQLIDRGDLSPSEMIGSWAGELGHFQFLPTLYVKYGLDYSGDGKRDLIRNAPDALASTANYLRGIGWRRGEPWLQEVRVPPNFAWDQADLAIQHPRTQWARWGVTFADGSPLPGDNLPASLLLPVGRFGPAFLAYENFKTYREWNHSLAYATTAAYYAARLAGAPPFSRGSANIAVLDAAKVRELQQILARQGHDVGNIDGILGVKTRVAVKAMQKKFGMPADSWPTPELMERIRAPRSASGGALP
jgi:lytic murein transglycosylase